MNNSTVKNTILIGVVLLFFLWLIRVLDISYPLTVTNINKSAEFSVIGEGKVDAIPNKAEVSLGVTAQNTSSVASAQQQINNVNNRLITAMKKLGIKTFDIKTTNYSLSPNYPPKPLQSGLSDYTGNATIVVTVRNITLVPQVLQAATDAGANEVQGINYTIDDPSVYREQARNKAIANAKEQAARLASTLGIRLGKITNIIETSPEIIPPIYRTMSAVGGTGGAAFPEVQPGTQTITSTVTLYFEKK